MTEEEESLLLQEPSRRAVVSDGGSEGTIDISMEKLLLNEDDNRSVASSSKFSISSAKSIGSRINNCKLTIRRLRKKELLDDKEKKRLQKALDFLDGVSIRDYKPFACISSEAHRMEAESEGNLMQPPKSLTCHVPSGQGSTALSPEEKQLGAAHKPGLSCPNPAKQCLEHLARTCLTKEEGGTPQSSELLAPDALKGANPIDVSPVSAASTGESASDRKSGEADMTLDSACTVISKPGNPSYSSIVVGKSTTAVSTGESKDEVKHFDVTIKNPVRQRANARRLILRFRNRDPMSLTEREAEMLKRAHATMDLTKVAWRQARNQKPSGAIERLTKPKKECHLPSSLGKDKPATPLIDLDKEKSGPKEIRSGFKGNLQDAGKKIARAQTSGGANKRLADRRAQCQLPCTSAASLAQPVDAAGKDSSKPHAVTGSSKRGRHDDTISPVVGRQAKRSKTLAQKVKESLRVAIVDLGNPERRLSDDQWKLLEIRILDGVNDAIIAENAINPLFGQLTTFKGFKVLECDNKYTLDWLNNFIGSTEAPWPNADLRVVDRKEILEYTRPKGLIHITGPYIPVERIERNLQHLNPELLSRDWKVIKAGEHTEDGMEVTVLLSHKSMPLLHKSKYKVRVGITRCRVQIVAEPAKKQTGRHEDSANKPAP